MIQCSKCTAQQHKNSQVLRPSNIFNTQNKFIENNLNDDGRNLLINNEVLKRSKKAEWLAVRLVTLRLLLWMLYNNITCYHKFRKSHTFVYHLTARYDYLWHSGSQLERMLLAPHPAPPHHLVFPSHRSRSNLAIHTTDCRLCRKSL